MKFDYLALCDQDKLAAVLDMLNSRQKKQWSTWQLEQGLGLPQPDFETLEYHEQNLVRTINLPLDTMFQY